MPNKAMVDVNGQITAELYHRLMVRAHESEDGDISKIFASTLYLYEVTCTAIKNGKRVGVVDAEGKLENEFINII